MAKSIKKTSAFDPGQFQKSPTGIPGLDEITGGGIPRGRPTLICGSAGCGKTLLAMEYLVAGATQFGEPGVFMSFEETEDELTTNVASLHFDLKKLRAQKKLIVDTVKLERSEVQETGEYDLEGLFVRLDHAIKTIGAKRVVLDTIEALFSGLNDTATLRAEIRRLFRWLKDRGVTAIITGEKGEGTLTRHGLEEYVSDCVILLDHRVTEQASTRRLRIVKYRGSTHGTNEYPFLIDKDGFSILPITSLDLVHPGTTERVSTGVKPLDKMFGGKGYMRGSSILISGTAGTGKTSLAVAFVIEAVRRKEKCLYFSFEESPGQLEVNMDSIGLNMRAAIKSGFLQVVSTRPSLFGLEMHLLDFLKSIEAFKPRVVVIDPVSSLIGYGDNLEVQSLLTRMIDHLKSNRITGLLTSLHTGANDSIDSSKIGISSLIDTWIVVRELEDRVRKRIRGLYVVKSRGMSHSNEVQKLILSDSGIDLAPVTDDDSDGNGHSRRPALGTSSRQGMRT